MEHDGGSVFRMPGTAGISYTLAWLCGLTLFASRPGPGATDAQLVDFYRDHRWSTSVQSLLVHGVAATALYIVAWVVWRRGLAGSWWLGAASSATVLSVVQLGLDLWRSNGAADPAGLVHIIDWLDGVKMLALARMVAAGSTTLLHLRVIRRPLQLLGWITAAFAAAGGLAYVAGIEAVVLAGVALVGLLVWVPCVALRVSAVASPSLGTTEITGVRS